MSPVINVENLGKKYTISHQQREEYSSLRDVLTNGITSLGKRLIKPFDRSLTPNPSSLINASEDFWALKDVSFEVKQGERIGIIGRNGAGKSTLLKILSRITEPTTGSVRIKGRVASLLEVGTGFHPELTGRENIFLNGAILGMGREEIKRKFDEIVDFAEIEKFLDTPVKRYSSGMYVRLAFAVAAHLEPEILIVDEVLAVGDAQFQKKCLGKMEDVGREGRTVLFVSHNMSAIRSLCDYVIMLDKGSIAFSGSTIEVIDKYLTGVQETNACSFDLADYRRSGHFGTSLRIMQLDFNQGKEIYNGQPLEVNIYFECYTDVEGVSLGVGFCNREGVRLLSLDSDIPGERQKFNKGESGKASFILSKLYLEPDTYTLDVGSRSNDNFGLEYLPQCGSVIVLPSEETPSVIAMRESGHGGVRLPTKWDFNFYPTSELSKINRK
jgi:lipopolysaccharide transport system ATP-binding protein